jgi:hypothetical protein
MLLRLRQGVLLIWTGQCGDRDTAACRCSANELLLTCHLNRHALYEDVVSNDTLAERYRQYMLQHLGLKPEQMVPLAEARVKHDQPGST